MTNYVHYSLTFLIQLLGAVITWLFNTEIISYENISISIGSTFVYFFIVYLVISLFLNAKVGLSHEKVVQGRKEKYHSNN